ncbi:hypothetical protein E3N88_10404 [Mikania micrantha]|uniref:Uncharacterized protein n=1 Tax=Mikania micrantha TaxID=192012 RepID=A0A5N6PAQ6_9ASTR|nr:hypothetical protein E3N88_10404 [Mikania micrantha]
MVPMPGKCVMVQTRSRSNDRDANPQNPIATQLAAIVAKLESFESLTAYIASLKAQRTKSDEEPTKSDEDYGSRSPKNPLAEQLVAIVARLDSLESHLREDIAFLKTRCEPSPNQVKKEALDNNHHDEEERLQLDKEEVSGDNPSDDEDQFQYVVGGQLEVCDGVQLKIEDLEKTQSHVEWLPTNLPFDGPIHMISWADRKEKWAKPDGWKDSDIVTLGKRGYICSHRCGLAHLQIKKSLFIGPISISIRPHL